MSEIESKREPSCFFEKKPEEAYETNEHIALPLFLATPILIIHFKTRQIETSSPYHVPCNRIYHSSLVDC